MLDAAYALLLEQVEGDGRAERHARLLAGQDIRIQDDRDNLDTLLAEEPGTSKIDPEERELRDALGLS